MAPDDKQQETLAQAITGITESLTNIVQEEIELAKAEVTQKAVSLVTGAAAVAAGAVFGVFALIFFLLTLAWLFNGIIVGGVSNLWVGFLIVFGLLFLMTAGVFLLAWRKLRVGPPTPKMAIAEAQKVRETLTASATKSAETIAKAEENKAIAAANSASARGVDR
jgi:ABC-type multidrug transport system fused ATPase/permease subunit